MKPQRPSKSAPIFFGQGSPESPKANIPSVPQSDACDPAELQEILMVEDSATDAELALRAFKLADFANPVTVAARSELGLDYLFGSGTFAARGPTRPHLILLDLGLPSMTGIDFLHRVRADRRTRDIPIVVLSLSERNADVTACIQLGAETYIVKPLNFENFSRMIAGLKLRLTLVARPRNEESGGWILSSSCAVLHVQSQRSASAERGGQGSTFRRRRTASATPWRRASLRATAGMNP